MTAILIVPGLHGSGPSHWQSRWQEQLHGRAVRVEQRDWEQPERKEWCATLERAVVDAGDKVLLVAHSLGCICVVHWAANADASSSRVAGALLVAPPDVESAAHTPEQLRSFAPIPLRVLPFPSRLVASRNDPFCELERARAWASAWGSRFVDVGELGHINAESNLGDWPQGRALLSELA